VPSRPTTHARAGCTRRRSRYPRAFCRFPHTAIVHIGHAVTQYLEDAGDDALEWVDDYDGSEKTL